METPLNAREFLKRFHLPQLVRISTTDELSSSPPPPPSTENHRAPLSSRQPSGGGGEQHERSDDWTYKSASGGHEKNNNNNGGFRSLVCPNSNDDDDASLNHDQPDFRSISIWPPGQLHQLPNDRSAEFCGPESPRVGNRQPARTAGDSIRLMPASVRPAQSKLELKQPFLLYKAYKKLELCAYSIDPNNQLNEKSGDPIYFPQNYPGWFSLLGQPDNQHHYHQQQQQHQRPLDSIDQVCQAAYSQIFLTRDELIAYQLPAKLSHLTKLKNNQLLALPLAISLTEKSKPPNNAAKDTNKQRQRESSTKENNGQQSISDLKRVIIQSGQVLKICGIYEDVMPLIEGKSSSSHGVGKHHPHVAAAAARDLKSMPMPMPQFQHHQQHHHPNYAKQQQQIIFDPHCSIACQQAALQQQQQQQFYASQTNTNGYNNNNNKHHFRVQQHTDQASSIQRQLLKLSKKAATVRDQQQQQPGKLHQQQRIASAAAAAAHAIYGQPPKANPAQMQPPIHCNPLRPAGQRYVRCMVLSQSSVDRMVTNSRLVEPALMSADCGISTAITSIGSDADTEVLIPLEQVGRFHLCACSGADLLRALSSRDYRSRLVFRLSQVISLLSLSKKLASSCQAVDCRRPLASLSNGHHHCFTLPLIAQLVIGPRPVNFSPSMFGSSSSMESYFSQERNIGGHSLGCPHHRSSRIQIKSTSQNSAAATTTTTTTKKSVNEPACQCAHQLSGVMTSGGSGQWFGLMSGLLRIERIAKREVLLACTIKLDPLEYLNSSDADGDAGRRALDNKHAASGATNGSSRLATAGGNSCVSGRLMALRETHNPKEMSTSSKLFGKSSFSRLRACRSLISLHGRSQKKRPDIPVCMLATSSRQPIPFEPADQPLLPGGGGGGAASKSKRPHSQRCRESSSAPAEPAGQQNQRQHQQLQTLRAAELIVMVEFDCNDSELRFVRTFVDSSLPTSIIPDLVLNRLEYCNKNSFDWERQLKLSHRSLSHDFDCYKQQLIDQQQQQRLVQSNRQTFSSSAALMYRDHQHQHHLHRDSTEEQHKRQLQQQQQQRRACLLLRPGDDDDQEEEEEDHSFGGQLKSTRAGAFAAAAEGGATCRASDSTASSRSSSGVSSAGDRKRISSSSVGKSNSLIILHEHGAKVASTSSSASASAASSTSGRREVASSSLASSATSSSTAAHSSSGRLLRLVNKILPGRSSAAIAAGNKRLQQQQHPLIDGQKQATTLMNSQKLHRRLLSGSSGLGVGERQLAAYGANLTDDEDDAHCDRSGGGASGDKGPAEEEEDDDHDDDGSHLYESLERISEQPANFEIRKSHRRPTDGATMDCRRHQHQASGRIGLNEYKEEGEDDSDSDWWADGSSSRESTLDDETKWTLDRAGANDRPAAFEGRGHLRAKRRAGGSLWQRNESAAANDNTMEPVSIEAIEEILVNDSSDDDDDSMASSLTSDEVIGCEFAGARPHHNHHHHHHRSNPILIDRGHNQTSPLQIGGRTDQPQQQQQMQQPPNKQQHLVYVNLQQSRSSSELDKHQQPQQPQRPSRRTTKTTEQQLQPISRMERKLLKIRSRRARLVVSRPRWPPQSSRLEGPQLEPRQVSPAAAVAKDKDRDSRDHNRIDDDELDRSALQQHQHCGQYRARPAQSSKPPPVVSTAGIQEKQSETPVRSLSSDDDDDNKKQDKSVNSLLSSLPKSNEATGRGCLRIAPRGGATGTRNQTPGDQVDGAVNSLRSELAAAAATESEESCESCESSSLASDERPATTSSLYSSSSLSLAELNEGSCKSSSADWTVCSQSDSSRQLAARARVGQVTADGRRALVTSSCAPARQTTTNTTTTTKTSTAPTTKATTGLAKPEPGEQRPTTCRARQ